MATRQEAKARGLKRYVGTICPEHPELRGERRTASGNCLKCKQAAIRRWHKNNPAVQRRKVAKWREANRDQYLAGALARNASRRARLKAATGDGEKIRLRFARLTRRARRLRMTVDHIVPLAGCRVCGAKGDHEPSNWQLLTSSDNSRKGDRCHECWQP